jgi:hypothetical protein
MLQTGIRNCEDTRIEWDVYANRKLYIRKKIAKGKAGTRVITLMKQ